MGIYLNDKERIGLLCLNKKIRQQLQPILSRYFHNFELQKKLINFVEKEDWNSVEHLLTSDSKVLNPNSIKFNSSNSEKITCVCLPQSMEEKMKLCKCAESLNWKNIPLILMFVRQRKNSFVELLFNHQRPFNFKLDDFALKEVIKQKFFTFYNFFFSSFFKDFKFRKYERKC